MIDFDLRLPQYLNRIKSSDLPALIYGMGNGADKVIDLFNSSGIEILGVTASDEFVRGQTFRGFTVKRITDFGGDYVITPAFGTCISEVMSRIFSLAESRATVYPCVPVAGDEIADDSFMEKYSEDINRAHSLFSGESRRVFEGYYNFVYSGELPFLSEITSEKREIFTSFLNLSGRGVYLDIGAYTGDTIGEYLSYTSGAYDEIIAVEPDKKSFAKLDKNYGGYDNITLMNKVCSSYSGFIGFDSSAGRQSRVSDTAQRRECVTVDEICEGKDVSYIKIDAEGEEMNILRGAVNTIRRCRPKLNIAVYHRFDDAFRIPLFISEILPGYKFEMRHHPYIPAWDTNLYCI